MMWFPRDKTCRHKLGFYFMKELPKYKGRSSNMFYCPLCLAMTIKINDLDNKKIFESFDKYDPMKK